MPVEIPYITRGQTEMPENVPVALPDKRITVGKIALGVFLGNLLTAGLALAAYFLLLLR